MNPEQQPNFDPGLTQQYIHDLTRAINKNGEFNVRRRGVTWHDFHPYLYLIHTSWPRFIGIVAITFVVVNLFFACLYLWAGIYRLRGAEAATDLRRFLNAFFFSAHTLTTVGYGNIWPVGIVANSIASAEALVGLMTFAIATGLLFGRFSRPSARIGFSRFMLAAPYRGGKSLQFRIVNRRANNLIDLEARVLLMTVEPVDGRLQRKYAALELERDRVIFFPLMWTIVHPLTESSPLFNKTLDDYKRLQVEVLILVKALDEAFGQNVQARYSYRFDEIQWDAKFKPGFEIGSDGNITLEVNQVSDFESVPSQSGSLIRSLEDNQRL